MRKKARGDEGVPEVSSHFRTYMTTATTPCSSSVAAHAEIRAPGSCCSGRLHGPVLKSPTAQVRGCRWPFNVPGKMATLFRCQLRTGITTEAGPAYQVEGTSRNRNWKDLLPYRQASSFIMKSQTYQVSPSIGLKLVSCEELLTDWSFLLPFSPHLGLFSSGKRPS